MEPSPDLLPQRRQPPDHNKRDGEDQTDGQHNQRPARSPVPLEEAVHEALHPQDKDANGPDDQRHGA